MKNIKFISGTSSEKVPYVYSYLYGMGYNVFTLVDNDKSGNKANKILADGDEHEELYSNLLTYDIINETNSEKFLLENLFSEQDLENFIPEKNTIYYKRLYDNYNTYDFSKETLNNLFDLLAEGAIISVISFHSLEDRIVKETFKYYSKSCRCEMSEPICKCGGPLLTLLVKKPIMASEAELNENPPSRSAKLRVAKYIKK